MKRKVIAHFDGGKLSHTTMAIDDFAPMLRVAYFQFPGRLTHWINYRLTHHTDLDAYYVPHHPHVTEIPGRGGL